MVKPYHVTHSAPFAVSRRLTHPEGRKRVALTLLRCVGTVGTPTTDTIVAYTRLSTGLL
jgi:hypothetical protein